MSYELIYAKRAERDFVDIFDYIAQDSIGSAIQYTENLRVRLNRLMESPRIGIMKDGKDLERILIVDKHKVHYRIISNKEQVLIRYIKHEKQR